MVIQGGVPAYVHAYGVSHFELITRRLRPLDLYTVPRLTNEIRVSCPLSAGHLSKQNWLSQALPWIDIEMKAYERKVFTL